jgi:hypothetical protein
VVEAITCSVLAHLIEGSPCDYSYFGEARTVQFVPEARAFVDGLAG